MTPAAHGRNCAACAKVVVDFTHFTDAELLAWLSQRAGQASCGRFRADQLGRELRPMVAPRPRSWRAWLAAAVAVWGLREAVATTAKAQATTEQQQREGEPISIADYVKKPVLLRGVVTDSASHDVLPGVTVLLAGTDLGASSDTNGQFELAIPVDTWAASTKQLSVSYIGYVKKEMRLSASTTQLLPITLAVDTHELGGLFLIGGYQLRPWYSPLGLWQRLKRPFYR